MARTAGPHGIPGHPRSGHRARFTGRYWDHHEAGIYTCVCCDTPLFLPDAKFDSGCGWPSYFEPIDPANVREKLDRSYGMRTEIICNVCDAHLGHVFPTARRRPDCAIASIRLRCVSTRVSRSSTVSLTH
jgi:methionine-R-sulfoxide reductase